MRRGRDFAFEKGANPPDASRELWYCIVAMYNWVSAFETSGQRRSPSGIASFGKFPHFICQMLLSNMPQNNIIADLISSKINFVS